MPFKVILLGLVIQLTLQSVKCYYVQPYAPYDITIRGPLSTGKKYLSASSDGSKVDLWFVNDGSGRQRWIFEPVPGKSGFYTIRIQSGISNARKYLSTTIDGSRIDLWPGNDGSGRQIWRLQPSANPGYYNIIIAGGVSSGKRFLSTNADGSMVDLWYADDGSGRQRWRLGRLSSAKTGLFNIDDMVYDNGESFNVSYWLLDVLVVLLVINCVCLMVYWYKKSRGNKKSYSVVSMESDSENENPK